MQKLSSFVLRPPSHLRLHMPPLDPEEFLRQDLLGFPPYTMAPVTTDDFARIIKLDANENAFGPSPRTVAALADFRHWHRYATQDELLPALARYVGVDASQLVVGNGGDELIDWIECAFLAPGDTIVNCPPTFEMYSHYAHIIGARVMDVPRRADFSIDVDAVERVISPLPNPPPSKTGEGRVGVKLLFLTNPNNPTGTPMPRADIERLLALPVMILLDEAYAEFGGETMVARVPTQPNLIILRTFSKWAGLAGLRVGYCVAHPRIADQLRRIKSPYNVNAAAIVAARASLDDVDYLRANIERIIAERERLTIALASLGFLQPVPSKTNFILCRVVGRDSLVLRDALASRGILIRAYKSGMLREYIRITVGTPEEDERLIQDLKELT
ncbi:MAG: histidinol-phosphate transaminase [Chloroflexi bacterium]|nr:histidinol-phosphate transaminase [Chloroflexota bacterium]